MSVLGEELLTIVRTEERAESILSQAQEEAKRRIEDARKRQEQKLATLPLQPFLPTEPKKPNSGIERIKTISVRNRQKAVARILEEFHATT